METYKKCKRCQWELLPKLFLIGENKYSDTCECCRADFTFKTCIDCKEEFSLTGFFTEDGTYSDKCNVCRIPWLRKMWEEIKNEK